jgi:hypothetical protein
VLGTLKWLRFGYVGRARAGLIRRWFDPRRTACPLLESDDCFGQSGFGSQLALIYLKGRRSRLGTRRRMATCSAHSRNAKPSEPTVGAQGRSLFDRAGPSAGCMEHCSRTSRRNTPCRRRSCSTSS